MMFDKTSKEKDLWYFLDGIQIAMSTLSLGWISLW